MTPQRSALTAKPTFELRLKAGGTFRICRCVQKPRLHRLDYGPYHTRYWIANDRRGRVFETMAEALRALERMERK